MNTLTLSGICKSFGSTRILHNVSLSVEDGEFLAIVGPSGCGKSTLLRTIAGLEPQDEGEIRLNDHSIDHLAPKARDVAMVFQSYALYPHMTVGQNISLPLVMRGLTRMERMPGASLVSKAARAKRSSIVAAAASAAEMVDLGGLIDRKPGQLSGGQRQRVALARALVRRPKLFLLDEPLSNLDAKLRAQTRHDIAELQRRVGVTTLYVTHDQVEAMTMASKIAVMMDGEIVQLGTPEEIYHRPADLRVAAFIGSPRINVLPAEVDAQGTLRIAGRQQPVSVDDGGMVTLAGIRPEHVEIVADKLSETIRGTIRRVEFLGSDVFAYVTVADTDTLVVARVEPSRLAGLGEGMTVGLLPMAEHLHLFDAHGKRLAADVKPSKAGFRESTFQAAE
ncbi:multiple sugar transport system ATP-binding protein [Rhodoligotrophos appendicifer]|uniref:ABC transporter ATP-binding protein n=1 Tax=Rhodoligotrophos appendicifer TaxID=987056 RepID=UPI00117F7ED9|nr:ABC transporter ATP-binding protein [Rhodoligotrophos appendicifer]